MQISYEMVSIAHVRQLCPFKLGNDIENFRQHFFNINVKKSKQNYFCRLVIFWSVLCGCFVGKISSLFHRNHQGCFQTLKTFLTAPSYIPYPSFSSPVICFWLIMICSYIFCSFLDYIHGGYDPYYYGRTFKNIPGGLLDDRRMRWAPIHTEPTFGRCTSTFDSIYHTFSE